MYASDGCYELIEMWKALQNGWQPPRIVTEEMYQEAKAGKFDPALTAFIGFGCSFGGKWFAGYARDPKSDRNYAANSENSIMKRLIDLRDVRFFFADYRRPAPQAECLIYADPPYAGTTGYHAVDGFNTGEFWQCVRNWATTGNKVIISEYAAPNDFACILEMPTRTDLESAGGGKDPRIERLFMHESQAHLYYENVPEQMELEL
jgi:DNA adenine methylase